jgi:copper(I)-binding protein
MGWNSGARLRAIMIAAISFLAASSASAADVTVTDAWIRALPNGIPLGGYFTLHNGTGKNLTLTGASSPACGMLMPYKTESMGGMASTHDVSEAELPAGGTLKFAPGGYPFDVHERRTGDQTWCPDPCDAQL